MSMKSDVCLICDQPHDLTPLLRKAKTTVKGQEVEYEEAFLVCPNATEEEREFVDGRLMNRNLLSALDAYRVSRNLLTSKEIKEIRRKLGLSQSDLSLLLGWGEVTVTRYETKAVQDDTYDQWMRLVSKDSLFALKSLEHHHAAFPETRYSVIRGNLIQRMQSEGNGIYIQEEIERLYFRFTEPDDFNGNRRIDIDKIESVIGYYAHHVHPLFKTSLMKLLWYADMLHFRDHRSAITGLVYVHQKYGALPIGFEELMRLPSVRVEEIQIDACFGYEVTSVLDRNQLNLTAVEEGILHDVVKILGRLSATGIVERMHQEQAYTKTRNMGLISFEYADRLNWPECDPHVRK
jgi:putative zinc finger/helix-turn-helix YgiT family protein